MIAFSILRRQVTFTSACGVWFFYAVELKNKVDAGEEVHPLFLIFGT